MKRLRASAPACSVEPSARRQPPRGGSDSKTRSRGARAGDLRDPSGSERLAKARFIRGSAPRRPRERHRRANRPRSPSGAVVHRESEPAALGGPRRGSERTFVLRVPFSWLLARFPFSSREMRRLALSAALVSAAMFVPIAAATPAPGHACDAHRGRRSQSERGPRRRSRSTGWAWRARFEDGVLPASRRSCVTPRVPRARQPLGRDGVAHHGPQRTQHGLVVVVVARRARSQEALIATKRDLS